MPAPDRSTLPLLRTRPLRALTLHAHQHPRGVAHLSAASGLVCMHGRAYVAADDEHHLAAFDDLHTPGTLHRVRSGDLPHGPRARKRRKPDAETLLWLPPPWGTGGALLALGSGSRPQRCTGFIVPLNRRGGWSAPVSAFDLSPLYRTLEAQLGGLNIEGAMLLGDQLVLLNRGGRDGLHNATARVPLRALHACIGGARHLDVRAQVDMFDLGSLDGVALGFTDAAALPGGRWLFSAAAELSADAVADGPCAGSVVGEMSARGELRTMRRLDRADKVEGLAVQPGGESICMVTDADDPRRCAWLLHAVWPRVSD